MADEELKEMIQDILNDDVKLQSISDSCFNNADTDNSGEIDRKELKKCFDLMATELGHKKPSDKDIEYAMKDLDTDGDNKVNKSEFKQLTMDYLRNLLEAIIGTV